MTRKRSPAHPQLDAEPVNTEPVELDERARARLRQRFGRLVGRGVVITVRWPHEADMVKFTDPSETAS